MIVIVTGSREFYDTALLNSVLDSVLSQAGGELRIMEGGETGAARLARFWALDNRVPVRTYKLLHYKFGDDAEHERDLSMLAPQPDLILMFGKERAIAELARRQSPDIEIKLYRTGA